MQNVSGFTNNSVERWLQRGTLFNYNMASPSTEQSDNGGKRVAIIGGGLVSAYNLFRFPVLL